jgi:hypothetical protein
MGDLPHRRLERAILGKSAPACGRSTRAISSQDRADARGEPSDRQDIMLGIGVIALLGFACCWRISG